MNRTESLLMWQRVADGDLDDADCNNEDLFRWIKSIAEKVIDADTKQSASQRPGGLVRALGLQGKEDPYAPLRELITLWIDFKFDDRSRSDDIAAVVIAAKKRGLLTGDYEFDENNGRDLIRSLWPK